MSTQNTGLPREDEPLLGRPGDVLQSQEDSYVYNVVRGTGVLAQAGGFLLLAVVWSGVFYHNLIVFSAHPLLNSAAIVVLTQGTLLLQPTHTPQQKRNGTLLHSGFNVVANLGFLTAFIIVEWNKAHSHLPHFESAHSILGAITYALLLIQAVVGITQYFLPGLYGGVDNAKKIYKYHRVLGYIILLSLLTTAVLATKTYYASKILHIKTWPVVLGGVLVALGVFPRIKKQKVQIFG